MSHFKPLASRLGNHFKPSVTDFIIATTTILAAADSRGSSVQCVGSMAFGPKLIYVVEGYTSFQLNPNALIETIDLDTRTQPSAMLTIRALDNTLNRHQYVKPTVVLVHKISRSIRLSFSHWAYIGFSSRFLRIAGHLQPAMAFDFDQVISLQSTWLEAVPRYHVQLLVVIRGTFVLSRYRFYELVAYATPLQLADSTIQLTGSSTWSVKGQATPLEEPPAAGEERPSGQARSGPRSTR
ncbi:hypothetical protein EVAR_77463_1 [Eumeta japonica]|uniref:Uncharacterized protein n=1 Tax=Eumeta variegata TaxID=151549 RepID=A0A4C1ZT69_EUMVA|nr:hypothetical protein EVAR_77463_1 [Eumeta japonica]